MLTRLGQTFWFGSVDHGFKTDVRMLPQSGPLEGRVADTMRGHHETDSSAMPVVNMVEGRGAQAPVTGPLRAPASSGRHVGRYPGPFFFRGPFTQLLPSPEGRGIRREEV